MEVWSGAATPPSSVVAVDSNGYITSYCSPVYSPVYYQVRARATLGPQIFVFRHTVCAVDSAECTVDSAEYG